MERWSPLHVDDIIRSGCHFVVIGHKLGKHADNEWRISGEICVLHESHPELKLVYATNYTQFLPHGLLKLFAKKNKQ